MTRRPWSGSAATTASFAMFSGGTKVEVSAPGKARAIARVELARSAAIHAGS